MQTIEASVVDSNHLKLSNPIPMQPGSKIRIMFIAPENTERESWAALSLKGLESAYGEDEPEYSIDLIKESNPEFAL
ncbi:MAG: hypothetical protein HC887_05875 [Desulfobacteraceae bacterium]|jgi:hypothetical protein|nr:hypothetical protein [Desulfobacteraceae bacterium]